MKVQKKLIFGAALVACALSINLIDSGATESYQFLSQTKNVSVSSKASTTSTEVAFTPAATVVVFVSAITCPAWTGEETTQVPSYLANNAADQRDLDLYKLN